MSVTAFVLSVINQGFMDMVFLFCSTFYFFTCVFVYMCMYTLTLWCTLRGKSSWESFLSFRHVHPKDQTQIFRLGKKYFYLLSHLASPSSLLIRFSNPMSSSASCRLPVFQRRISQVIQCQITCFCAVLRTSINSLSKNLFSICLRYSHSYGHIICLHCQTQQTAC